MKDFLVPSLVSALVLVGVYIFLGLEALFIAVLLVILEVTLSFDNAVVNAKVLMHMEPKWQQRFLTWGILFAVFFTRFVLPILIVSASVLIDPWTIGKLAFLNPEEYGDLLHDAHYAIGSFGAIFLLMVSLKFFINSAKETHWFGALERHLRQWGRLESIEIALALISLVAISFFVPLDAQATVLVAGAIGLILFILMEGIASFFGEETKNIASKGFALFMYLQVLDTAFSLDSVVGAFALTTSLPIIMIGLSIGAYFVRVMTIYFVKHKTLSTLVYLEHGAHYAIFGLAISMLVSLLTPIPELITGTIGVVFVIGAYYSSLRHRKRSNAKNA